MAASPRGSSAAVAVAHPDTDTHLLDPGELHILVRDPEALKQRRCRLTAVGLLPALRVVGPRDRRVEAIGHAAHEVVVGKNRDRDVAVRVGLDGVPGERLTGVQAHHHLATLAGLEGEAVALDAFEAKAPARPAEAG